MKQYLAIAIQLRKLKANGRWWCKGKAKKLKAHASQNSRIATGQGKPGL